MVVTMLVMQLWVLIEPASAHRSGCHSWHSCPSDTESYTCGDTGHSNYCGASTYTPPARDYTAEGQAAGTLHATTKNITNINAGSSSAGDASGYADGWAGQSSGQSTVDTTYCDRVVQFETPPPDAYSSSFQASYSATCKELYQANFAVAYGSGYSRGVAARQAANSAPATTTTGGQSNSVWVAWAVLAVFSISAIVGVIKGL